MAGGRAVTGGRSHCAVTGLRPLGWHAAFAPLAHGRFRRRGMGGRRGGGHLISALLSLHERGAEGEGGEDGGRGEKGVQVESLGFPDGFTPPCGARGAPALR